MDHRATHGTQATQGAYEPPQITVLGEVHDLTQGSPKLHGHADGMGFGGHGLTSSS